jgi:hypothetical protein
MNIDDVFPSKWIDPADLKGKDVTLTIEAVQMEKVGMDSKPVIYFKGARKGLIINPTRKNSLKAALGSANTDDWIGQEVTLYVGISSFNQKETIMIRERSAVGAQPVRAAAASMPPDFQPPTRQIGDEDDIVF